ncbi:hypothetical protein [Desulfocurvus sp. DL9XJH121]
MNAVLSLLKDHLASPAPAGPEAEALAEQALGFSGPGDWREALGDPDHPDRSALAELLLFPDLGLRLALEPELPSAGCGPGDEAVLIRGLAGAGARFLLPGGEPLEFVLSGEDAELFVRRLRLGRVAPPEVLAALEPLAPEAGTGARARLRRSRFAWEPGAAFVVRSLALRLGGEEDFADLLDWLCLFLESLEGQGAVSPALAARYAESETRLKDHLAFMQRLEKSNFETMLLTGDRAPHADPEALRRDMAASQRIRLAVFNVPAAPPVAQRELGEVAGDESGVRDIMRLLG